MEKENILKFINYASELIELLDDSDFNDSVFKEILLSKIEEVKLIPVNNLDFTDLEIANATAGMTKIVFNVIKSEYGNYRWDEREAIVNRAKEIVNNMGDEFIRLKCTVNKVISKLYKYREENGMINNSHLV